MADQILEFAHLLADRRLRAVHTFGCAGEAAFVDYADKGFQQFQIQHGGVPDSGFANDDRVFI
ncbi:hypothetical protein SRABI89_05382 [Pseudomonas koreensis]|nr:hypothetical protein SRABI89_05382 [Pseudomonas koreensis]